MHLEQRITKKIYKMHNKNQLKTLNIKARIDFIAHVPFVHVIFTTQDQKFLGIPTHEDICSTYRLDPDL